MNEKTNTIDNLEQSAENTFNLLNYIINIVKQYLPNIIFAIIFFIVGYIVAKIITHILRKITNRTRINLSASNFLSQAIFVIIMLVIAIIALGIAGVPMTQFNVLLGGFGVAIGLGFQNNIANLSSGIIIIINGLYKIGDFVTIERGVDGTVTDISLMTTTITTIDLKSVYVPNNIMTSEYVMNYSSKGVRTFWIKYEITQDSNYEKALKLLKKCAEESEYVLKNEPVKSHIVSLNNGRVTLEASATCKSKDYMDYTYDMNKRVKKSFDENGIKFFEFKNIIK